MIITLTIKLNLSSQSLILPISSLCILEVSHLSSGKFLYFWCALISKIDRALASSTMFGFLIENDKNSSLSRELNETFTGMSPLLCSNILTICSATLFTHNHLDRRVLVLLVNHLLRASQPRNIETTKCKHTVLLLMSLVDHPHIGYQKV